MTKFKIYFFKDRTAKVDFEEILDFFEKFPEVSFFTGENEVVVSYTDEQLNNKFDFYLSKKLIVPNIYKLNPRYINLNFHMEMNALIPDFCADIIFNLIKELSQKFDLHIYNELFENILPFRAEVVKTAFQYFKKMCKEKYPDEYQEFYYMEKDRLTDCLNYQRQNYELQLYYKEDDLIAPRYIYLVNIISSRPYLAIEWKEDTTTIFPPNLDYIYYNNGDTTKILIVDQVFDALDKYLLDLPGFIKGTKMIEEKSIKKIKKIMNKTNFNLVDNKFEIIEVNNLIDV